ncbi:MAG: hypothetical protein WC788_02330 [Candidatus Paceibacterota bacterium]|jgi:hypothetical protein
MSESEENKTKKGIDSEKEVGEQKEEQKDPISEIGELIEKIQESLDSGDTKVAVGCALALAEKVAAVSPELAVVINKITQAYGGALKPLSDELCNVIAGTIGYAYEKSAQINEGTFESFKKHMKARAERMAAMKKAYVAAGFEPSEAMQIILAEIAKEGAFSIPGDILKVTGKKKVKKENKKESKIE